MLFWAAIYVNPCLTYLTLCCVSCVMYKTMYNEKSNHVGLTVLQQQTGCSCCEDSQCHLVAFFLSKVHLCVGILRELEEARRRYQYSIGIFHAGVTSPLIFFGPTTPHKNARARPRSHLWVEIFFFNCH